MSAATPRRLEPMLQRDVEDSIRFTGSGGAALSAPLPFHSPKAVCPDSAFEECNFYAHGIRCYDRHKEGGRARWTSKHSTAW